MPALLKSQTGSEFFNELDFSLRLKNLVKSLLGEVRQPDWMKTAISWKSEEFSLDTRLELAVRFEPYRFEIPLGGFGDSRRLQYEPLTTPKEWRSSMSLSPQLVRDTSILMRNVMAWLEGEFRNSAYLWYAFDPRWGTPGGRELPHCPLFDPPVRFSRNGEPLEVETQEWVGGTRGVALDTPTCAFCGETLGATPYFWAGSNLWWVHTECWRQVS